MVRGAACFTIVGMSLNPILDRALSKITKISFLTLIRLTFERLARTGWWWLSPPPEKSVITQLVLLIFGHKIPQMKVYIVLNPQCIASVLPDPFILFKRGQKYLKIAKSHYFIYFVMISEKSLKCSILWLYNHKK